jgi:selenocysteine lyase/cysteine desulfurase
VVCKKDSFLLDGHIHYLNCAMMSPNLQSVVDAGIKGMHIKSAPQYITADHFFDDTNKLKKLFAAIVHADDHERVAIFPSVSYGMAIVAKNLYYKKGVMPGDEIIVVSNEFPSDVFAWADIERDLGVIIKTISPNSLNNRGENWNNAIIAAISIRTKLVVVPHVHWQDGTVFDLMAIRARTAQVGAWMVVDGSQSLGALPIDVSALQPDALIAVGYKCLLGPYGLSYGYFGSAFDEGRPIENNWINKLKSDDFANLTHYQHQFRPKAARYCMGEQSNFILLPMCIAALEQVLSWGVENINSYCDKIAHSTIDALLGRGYYIEEKKWRSSHLFGVRLHSTNNMEKFQEKCKAKKISLSVRRDAIRVSLNVWNTEEDLQQLLLVINEVD